MRIAFALLFVFFAADVFGCDTVGCEGPNCRRPGMIQHSYRKSPLPVELPAANTMRIKAVQVQCNRGASASMLSGMIVATRDDQHLVLTCKHGTSRGQMKVRRFQGWVNAKRHVVGQQSDVMLLTMPKHFDLEDVACSARPVAIGTRITVGGFGAGYHERKGRAKGYEVITDDVMQQRHKALTCSGYMVSGDSGGAAIDETGTCIGVVKGSGGGEFDLTTLAEVIDEIHEWQGVAARTESPEPEKRLAETRKPIADKPDMLAADLDDELQQEEADQLAQICEPQIIIRQGARGPGYVKAHVAENGLLSLLTTEGKWQTVGNVKGPQGETGGTGSDAQLTDEMLERLVLEVTAAVKAYILANRDEFKGEQGPPGAADAGLVKRVTDLENAGITFEFLPGNDPHETGRTETVKLNGTLQIPAAMFEFGNIVEGRLEEVYSDSAPLGMPLKVANELPRGQPKQQREK